MASAKSVGGFLAGCVSVVRPALESGYSQMFPVSAWVKRVWELLGSLHLWMKNQASTYDILKCQRSRISGSASWEGVWEIMEGTRLCLGSAHDYPLRRLTKVGSLCEGDKVVAGSGR